MRDWFLGQGIPMYAETALLVVGLVTLWITGRIYKNLIREAELMGTSNHRLIKYIRLKVSSYYKLGMRPEDTQALIGRYLKKYDSGLFSLQTWTRLPDLIMTAMLAVGGGFFIYRWTAGKPIYEIAVTLMAALMGVLVIAGLRRFMDFSEKEKLLVNSISDYIDNFLRNKLAQDYKAQAGQVSPEQYKRALQEIAATGPGRRKNRNNQYYYDSYGDNVRDCQSDEVDAKIVEDVLKEFLC